MLKREKINYSYQGMPLIGYAVFDDTWKNHPAVLIAHDWRGLNQFAKNKAEELVKLGYVAFAMDLYGNGKVTANDKESAAEMGPLFVDRETLRGRELAALEALKQLPQVDKKRIGAIGFCFGGLAVQELAKSGADIRGIVSFHGLLGTKHGDLHAKPIKNADKIIAKMLVLHGHEDPSVTPEDIRNFQKEMSEAKVDWQMHIYSHTCHAFTNPERHDKEHGLAYNLVADKRSWLSMKNFFEEIFIQDEKGKNQ